MIGVIYARYSEGPRQTDQSIEGQVNDCMAYASRNDIQVVEVYADRHISGKSTVGRDEFLRMMQDSDKHKFDCVIVWKVDRFGRNRQDIAFNKYRLKKNNVKLMYAAESIPDSPEGILLESLMEGLAEYYSADLSQKVKRGIRESAIKGKMPCGSVPIGYQRDAEGKCVADPFTAPLVEQAYKMYVDGYKLDDIVQMFTVKGIKGLKGSKISNGVLYRMFRNTAYLGEYVIQDVTIPIPQIISQELFDMAQLRNNATKKHNARKPEVYMLSCKLFCGECGCMYVGESGTSKNGMVHRYYKCGNAKRNKSCDAKPIPAKKIEDIVVNTTIETVLTDEVIERLCDEIELIQEAEKKNSPVEHINNQIKELDRKIDNLVNVIAESGNALLSSKLAQFQAERNELDNLRIKAEIENPTIAREVFRAWMLDFKDGNKDDVKFRSELVDAFVNKIIVNKSELQIIYNVKNLCSDLDVCLEMVGAYPNTIPFNVPYLVNNHIILRVALHP